MHYSFSKLITLHKSTFTYLTFNRQKQITRNTVNLYNILYNMRMMTVSACHCWATAWTSTQQEVATFL